MKFKINYIALACCLLVGGSAYGSPWQQMDSYSGDCKARPAGTVCVRYGDGYIWLVRGAITGWKEVVESGQKIQVAIATTGRYRHLLYTNYVCAFSICDLINMPHNTGGGEIIDKGTNALPAE